LDESPTKHLIDHGQSQFDVGIYMSEWLPLKIRHNYPGKALCRKWAFLSSNLYTDDLFHEVLWVERIEHIDGPESLLVVCDIFGISLPFETSCTQYRK
jgi:hypothetical protein